MLIKFFAQNKTPGPSLHLDELKAPGSFWIKNLRRLVLLELR